MSQHLPKTVHGSLWIASGPEVSKRKTSNWMPGLKMSLQVTLCAVGLITIRRDGTDSGDAILLNSMPSPLL